MADRIKPIENNPGFLSDEELIKSFVVRLKELQIVLGVIRDNTTASNQHMLVIGPRGIGKTMLVRRAVAEVRRDEELCKRWTPIVFAEESYSVKTPGEFWLEALFHLHRQTNDEMIERTYLDLKKESSEPRLHERALGELLDYADRLGKRLLLVVENLNMLLGEQIDQDGAWVLRKTLMHEPRIMLLATATQRFKELKNYGKAMFELFRGLTLDALNTEECRQLWMSVTDQKDVPLDRIRPIEILTGGSPRLMAIVSRFGANMSVQELMNDLVRLVDEHTEYFKSHLDSLPPVERAVYVSLLELWDPSTAREVAAAARLGVSKTSALLKRLMERRAVTVRESKKRTKLYQVAERMYNIYYLMRRSAGPGQRVRAVVDFMVHFYRPEELPEVTNRIALEACQIGIHEAMDHCAVITGILSYLEFDKRETIIAQLPESIQKMTGLSLAKIQEEKRIAEKSKREQRVTKLLHKAKQYKEKGEVAKAERLYRRVITIDCKNQDALFALALLLVKTERSEEGLKIFIELTECFPNSSSSWVGLGMVQYHVFGRVQEARENYKKALNIDPQYGFIWEYYAKLLHDGLGEYEEAERAYRKAIDLDPELGSAWINLARLLSDKMDRPSEAEMIYKTAIEKEPENGFLWGKLAELLYYRLKRYEASESAYRKCLELQIDPKYLGQFMRQLGDLLWRQRGLLEEGEKLLRKSLEINPQMPGGWWSLGLLLKQKGGSQEEAEKACRRAIEIVPEMASAWFALGQVLYDADDPEKAEQAAKAYEKVTELDPHYVPGWVCLARSLSPLLGREKEAEEVLKKAIKIIPDNWFIWVEIGGIQEYLLDQYQDALYAYHKVTELAPNAAEGWIRLAKLNAQLGNIKEGLDNLSSALSTDSNWIQSNIHLVTAACVEIASLNYGRQALKVLEESTNAKLLEPLMVGLKIYLGDEVKVATEIEEVGKDVAKRIEARRKEIEERKKS